MTKARSFQRVEVPSSKEQGTLVQLLLQSSGQRISSALLDGRRIWIKHCDIDARPLTKRLHQLVSPLLPKVFLRASKRADAKELLKRELRKMKAFRKAGFAVPEVLYHGATTMVLSHVARIAEDELQRLHRYDPRAHDMLLVGAAEALGRAHSAGLCHGRPHPRDMFVAEGRWGFVDFEEEPEAVMPLRLAQARDLWLLFLQISDQALTESTQDRALSAYMAVGPAGAIAALESIVTFFSPLLPLLDLLEKVSLGSDGRRVLKATRYLKGALPRMGADIGPQKVYLRLDPAEGVKEGP